MNKSGPFNLRWRGQISGPFSREEILQKLDDREIGLWHELGREGEWVSLGEFLEQEKREHEAAAKPPALAFEEQPTVITGRVRVELPSSAPDVTNAPAQAEGDSRGRRPRSTKLFVLLGAVLGFTGAHNFYAGYWGTAIAQFVLSGVTLALGFGFFVSWVWALIELVIVHTDARGVRLK